MDRQADRRGRAHASFLFAFEESHGYLKGTHARDKDAAVGALLFAELAATVKDRKQTVLEYLDDLFIDVGHHGDRLINKVLEGREGLAQIKQLMAAFRSPAPRQIGGLTMTEVYDYKTHEVRTLDRSAPRPAPCPSPRATCSIFHTERPGDPIRRASLGNRAKNQVLSLRIAPTWPDLATCPRQNMRQLVGSIRWHRSR